MKKGLVSVFIPSYNYERYLGAAIDSILAQTYPDWELIIVDDASRDDSPALIERYRRRNPERIRSVLLKENVGQSEATNIGLKMAGGEFVALLAADDLARPQRLADGVALLRKRPEVVAAFSRVSYIDAEGRPLPDGASLFNRAIDDIRWRLLEGNFICGTSVVARLSAIHEAGGYNRTLGYVEDYDLWLRLLDRHELVRVDDIWVDYRLHGDNLSLARSRGDIRFGTLYESVAVAVRAMHRWPPERLHAFRHRKGTEGYRKELAEIQLRLARCCLQLEQNFLRQVGEFGVPVPALGVSAAYGFLLDALQNDAGNAGARNLLSEVYAALGDGGRSAGGKSSSLAQIASAPAAGRQEPAVVESSAAVAAPENQPSPYEQWLEILRPTRVEAIQYDRLAAAGGLGSRFHLVTLLPPGGESLLIGTLKSLTSQLLGNVLFTIVAATDAPPGFGGERLRWLRAEQDPIASANAALSRENADWVGLVTCGDRLAETALAVAAEAMGRNPQWQAVYSDDDCLEADGRIHSPRLKPGFDLTLLRGMHYADGLVLARRDVFAAVGGFDGTLGDIAARYDLLLRIAERGGDLAIGHLPGPQLHKLAGKPMDPQEQLGVLDRHLGRSEPGACIQPAPLPGSFKVGYSLQDTPLVSIVLPTCNRLPLLARCIESILAKTAYAGYEILAVHSGDVAAEVKTFLAGLGGLEGDRIRVVACDGPFSLAALFNAGARAARGSHLLFLHDDVAALHPEWLEKMVAHSRRHGVGAVGARLLHADGRLQHAGIVLGLAGAADLAGGGAALDDPGLLGRYALDQEVAAASAACLLVRGEVFAQAGGFDDEHFPVFLPEVDLCLRIAQSGWKTVWTAQATLLHDGPGKLADGVRSAPYAAAERARRWSAERDRLLRRWLGQLARDTHYNRLHSLHTPAFRLCEDPLLARDPLPWKPLPRVLAQPADREGCGHYRISAPLLALARAGTVQGFDSMDFYTPVEVERLSPDTMIFQRPYTDAQYAYLEQAAKYGRARRIFELDDLITQIPARSIHRGTFPNDLVERLKRAAGLCDRLVVSTPPLAQALRSWHPDIRIALNRIPMEPWSRLAPAPRSSSRPRVGWAGAFGHEGDLLLMSQVIAETSRDVDWVFLGHCPEALRTHIREIHPVVRIADYPAALAGLALDVAIAPLEINAFNEAKSHLKLLEYGILGYPVICSDILPYQGDFPVTRVANKPQRWIDAVREHVADLDESRRRGGALREHVLAHWMLEDHLEEWRSAWLG